MKNRQVARGNGLADNTIYRWRKRNPGNDHLAPEEIAKIVLRNKAARESHE